MVILGGAFLITPGFITDVIGLLLLIPPSRAIFRGIVARLARRRAAVHGPSRRLGVRARHRPRPARAGAPRATTTRGRPARCPRPSASSRSRSGDAER